jgi:hypothetical protein
MVTVMTEIFEHHPLPQAKKNPHILEAGSISLCVAWGRGWGVRETSHSGGPLDNI